MTVISKINFPPIPSVKFKGLKWASADCVAVLGFTREIPHGFQVGVVLDNTHDQPMIEFDPAYLPPRVIPKFTIDFSCFDDSADANTTIGWALAMVLNAETSIIFSHDGDKIHVELKICHWVTEGRVELEAVKAYLLPK